MLSVVLTCDQHSLSANLFAVMVSTSNACLQASEACLLFRGELRWLRPKTLGSSLATLTGRSVSPPNSHGEILKPLLPVPQNVTIFGDRFFKEVIRLDEVIGMGLNPI